MFTARKVSARTIAIIATALTVLVGLIVVLIVLPSSDEKPNASNHTVIQSNTPPNTEPTSTFETVPYQPVIGADGKKLWVDVEHNPALNCPDHRNHSKKYEEERDLHQFVPCVNGMIHLRVNADGTVQVIHADGKLDFRHLDSNVPNGDDPAEGWKISAYTQKEKDRRHDNGSVIPGKTYTLLAYYEAAKLTPFQNYWNNDGNWELVVNLNDRSFERGKVVDVVLTWTDPDNRGYEPKLPFKWEDVTKSSFYSVR